MGLSAVAERIWKNPSFQSRYVAAIKTSIAAQFGQDCFAPQGVDPTASDWAYLLQIASLFSHSDSATIRSAALRIAQACMATPEIGEHYHVKAGLILHSLANGPAIELAQRRQLLEQEWEKNIPFAFTADIIRRSITNTIVTSGGQFFANEYQLRLWKSLRSQKRVATTAPTSAGKSFTVLQYLLQATVENPRYRALYVVPTRALINQVQKDILQSFSNAGRPPPYVATLPWAQDRKVTDGVIFVLTQERVQLLINSTGAELHLDAIIVDEAQKLSDAQRGILLQQVLDLLEPNNPKSKVVFAAPFAENPEALLDTPTDDQVVSTDESPVAQNVIWLTQVERRPSEWIASWTNDTGAQQKLGQLTLPNPPHGQTKRLTYIAHAFGKSGAGNLVYANRPSDAETIAAQLHGLSKERKFPPDDAIKALIELCRKSVHPEFQLGDVLNRRIAFHYGNIPQLIRMEVERLFADGTLEFLVCTSTLVEGVNSACRNIFLREPKRGNGKLMSAEDFWNLAGRAGRWGREFQGNVFCIDANKSTQWQGGSPPRGRSRFRIQRSVDEIVTEQARLNAFIMRGGIAKTADERALEYAYSYLSAMHCASGGLTGSAIAKRLGMATLEAVKPAISSAMSNFLAPPALIERNPGISPSNIDLLYRYFAECKGKIELLLPPDLASDDGDDAVKGFADIFELIGTYLNAPSFSGAKQHYKHALLVTNWMRGRPIPFLVDKRSRYLKRHSKFRSMAQVIRDVLHDIEAIARFEAPKYLSCYTDVLRAHLAHVGRDDLVKRIQDLSLFLELGVAFRTQLSLMSLGLSRTATIMLSELITSDDLSPAECLDWLLESPWQNYDLPVLVKQEISNVLETASEHHVGLPRN